MGGSITISAEAAAHSAPDAPPLLPARGTYCLLALTFLYGGLTGWALNVLPLPGAGWLSPQTLPLTLSAAATVAAAFFAPFLKSEAQNPPRHQASFAIFSALWQALLLFFFLQLAARLSTLSPGGSLKAAFWLFQSALLLNLLARVVPAAVSGIAFAWIAVLPLFVYILAELTMIGSARIVWQQMNAGDTEAVAIFVRVALQLSPFTAILGALNGHLLDNSLAVFTGPMIGFGVVNLLLLYFVVRTRNNPSA